MMSFLSIEALSTITSCPTCREHSVHSERRRLMANERRDKQLLSRLFYSPKHGSCRRSNGCNSSNRRTRSRDIEMRLSGWLGAQLRSGAFTVAALWRVTFASSVRKPSAYTVQRCIQHARIRLRLYESLTVDIYSASVRSVC